MKKLLINEEFSVDGKKFCFTKQSEKLILKSLGVAGKSKEFVPPSIEEVREFFKLKGYIQSAADKFHEYYELGQWHDGGGKPVKNWKQKASSVWFRDEHKIKESTPKEKDKYLF
jgi:hypothetical protein